MATEHVIGRVCFFPYENNQLKAAIHPCSERESQLTDADDHQSVAAGEEESSTEKRKEEGNRELRNHEKSSPKPR